jgi:DNA-binding Xre family transcriptional regulator
VAGAPDGAPSKASKIEFSRSSEPAPDPSGNQTPGQVIAERAARRQAVVNPILKQKRWKIGRLVTKSGVGKATVYGYVNGMRSWISKENRDAICQCLDLAPDKLPE